MNTIGLLLLLALIGLGWWNAVGARTRARRAARRACREADVLFIDELALRRLRLTRDPRSRLCLERDYGFEFIVRGDQRYAGAVVVQGQRVAAVHMDPYPFRPDPDNAG